MPQLARKILSWVLPVTIYILLLIPVDGGWSEFNEWSACSLTCGGGTQSRTRTCDNPPPLNAGRSCAGEPTEVRACETKGCPGKNNPFF